MSAIASAAASPQAYSPLSRLKTELSNEISAGTISSADQSALSSALDDIDSAMLASRPSGGSKPPSPDEMQAKIESLIEEQVSTGKLTSDQAEELKDVFASAFKDGPGGPGGARGAGGPPPGPPPGEEEEGSSSASSSSTSDSDISELLSKFLEALKSSKSGSSTYGASGDSLASQIKSLLVDYQA